MLKMKPLFLLVAVLVAGCATTDYRNATSEEVAAEVKNIASEFSAHDMLSAPPISHSPEMGMQYELRLIAVVDRTSGDVTHTISTYWRYTYSSWRYFSRARLAGGQELETSQGRRQVLSCGRTGMCQYEEVMSAAVPEQNLDGELRIQFLADRGAYDVTVPASYVSGYLQGVQSRL